MDITQKQIMLVDDEPTITKTLELYLRAAGYTQVLCLNDPLEVEAAVSAKLPDVLLMDISMPGRDGLKILESLGDYVVNDLITVIMVTSCEQDYIKRKALILGACDFISKPVNPEDLLKRVANALNGRPNMDFILNTLPPRSAASRAQTDYE